MLSCTGNRVQLPSRPVVVRPGSARPVVRSQAAVLQRTSETNNMTAAARLAHHFFEQRAQKSPDSVCLRQGETELTYSEVNQHANSIAQRLQETGLQAGQPVAVALERSILSVTAFLAVLKAGGAYVGTDVTLDLQKLGFLVMTSRSMFCVTEPALSRPLQAGFPHVKSLILEEDDRSTQDLSKHAENVTSTITEEKIAAISFTSGSSGIPKGVQLSHASIAYTLMSLAKEWDLASHTTFLHAMSLAWGSSLVEMLLPLSNGLSLAIAGQRQPGQATRIMQTGPDEILRQVDTYGITGIMGHPSMVMDILRTAGGKRQAPSVKLVFVGGEMLPEKMIKGLKGVFPNAGMLNVYGSTESGLISSFSVFDKLNADPNSSPVGRPFEHVVVYILDEEGKQVPEGEPGEIFLSGKGLATTYCGNEEASAAKWVPNPFADSSPKASSMMCKSGDRGRIHNGQLELMGRTLQEVKVRGDLFVDLAKVERIGKAYDNVKDLVAVAQPDIVTVCVEGDVDAEALHKSYFTSELKHAAHLLKIEKLAQLPRLPSGKVDRTSLQKQFESE